MNGCGCNLRRGKRCGELGLVVGNSSTLGRWFGQVHVHVWFDCNREYPRPQSWGGSGCWPSSSVSRFNFMQGNVVVSVGVVWSRWWCKCSKWELVWVVSGEMGRVMLTIRNISCDEIGWHVGNECRLMNVGIIGVWWSWVGLIPMTQTSIRGILTGCWSNTKGSRIIHQKEGMIKNGPDSATWSSPRLVYRCGVYEYIEEIWIVEAEGEGRERWGFVFGVGVGGRQSKSYCGAIHAFQDLNWVCSHKIELRRLQLIKCSCARSSILKKRHLRELQVNKDLRNLAFLGWSV